MTTKTTEKLSCIYKNSEMHKFPWGEDYMCTEFNKRKNRWLHGSVYHNRSSVKSDRYFIIKRVDIYNKTWGEEICYED